MASRRWQRVTLLAAPFVLTMTDVGRLQSPISAPAGHDERLDGIRALAVVAVMLVHCGYLPGGSIGVDVFFVLSGYLITGILAREARATGRIDVRRFLLRRARRLAPALVLLLTVCIAAAPLVWGRQQPAEWLDVGAAALYLTDFREAIKPSFGPLSHTWSLAIEEQFYLVWPVVALSLCALPRKAAVLGLLLCWSVLTVARVWAYGQGGALDQFAYYSPLHASGLVLGAALALAGVRLKIGTLALAVVALVALLPHSFWQTSVAELGAALVIAAPPAFLAWRPLAWLGTISYGAYLWHIPVMHALRGLDRTERMVGTMLLTIVMAAASYYGLERRFLKRSTAARAESLIATVHG